ncbi:MAG: hypothetical protein V1917_01780 [Candidatus Gottesmanbacteria bacterium]
MAPENANIFYVDDDQVMSDLDIEYLEGMGHHVIEQATSLAEAKQKIPKLKETNVQVAVIDGNLTPGNKSGADGEIMAKAIHKKFPEIIVIGHSKDNPIIGADINVSKKAGLVALGEAVTKA